MSQDNRSTDVRESQENFDRQWERGAEEEIRKIFREANVPIEEFKNHPDIQRRVIEILESFELPLSLEEILERYPGLREKVKTQEEISAMEIPESESLIDKGYKIGIIGEMQSGKSLLALRIGQDLVEGKPILGYFPWDTNWRVLYVNFELPEAEMVARFSFFGSNPDYVLLNSPIIDLENEAERSPITNLLEAYRGIGRPFDAVILDPKVNCFAGDENQTQDNIRWCAACDKLAKDDNLCLIIVNHFGRNTTAKGGRGNTTFGGWLTKRLELKGSDGDIRKTLKVRGKVGESLDLLLKLNYPIWEVESSTIAVKVSKVSVARTFIMVRVPEDRTPLIKAANLEGITQSIFKEAQNQLEGEGLIRVIQAEGAGNRKRLIPTQ